MAKIYTYIKLSMVETCCIQHRKGIIIGAIWTKMSRLSFKLYTLKTCSNQHNQGVSIYAIWSVAELSDTTVIATYLRGINLIYAQGSGIKTFYSFNAHGDVVQLSDASGNVIKNYDYDAFGNEYDLDENDGNPWQYCGEYCDGETGTVYLRARYYSPKIGRFLTEDTHWNVSNMLYGDNPVKWNDHIADSNDPLGLNTYTYKPDIAAIMQSGNTYVYCIHNPLTYIDTSGEFVITLTAAGAAALFGLLAAGAAYCTYKIAEVAIPEIYNAVKNSRDKAAQRALNNLAGYVGAPMPLPPNDPKSSGTNTTVFVGTLKLES